MSHKPQEISQRDRISILIQNAHYAARIAWKSSPILFGLVLSLNFLTALFPVIQVYIMRELINVVLAAQGLNTFTAEVSQIILLLGIVLFAQVLISLAYQLCQRLFQDRIHFKVSIDIMEHSASLDARFFENPNFQDRLERLRINVSNQVGQFMGTSLDLLLISFEILGLVLLLLSIQPYIVAITGVIVLPYFILNNQNAKISYQLEFTRVRKRRWMNYFMNLLMSYENVFELRLLNLAPLLIQGYRKSMQDFIKEDEKLLFRKLGAALVFGIVLAGIMLALVYWVILEVIRGILSIGDIAVYIGAFTRLRSNLERITTASSQILEQVLFIDDLRSFMNLEASRKGLDLEKVEKLEGNIRFEHVYFAYPESAKEVLRDISLEIKAGEIVAIVGKNGAGKTSLVKLLAGFYEPSRGEIYLDGQAISKLDSQSVYRQITFVMQNFNRYEASIHENVAYGDWEKLLDNPQEVKRLAEMVEIMDFVEELPQGYETVVGRSFGLSDLSGGQWQKLALARAFARNASIVILDEPSSQLDPLAEYQLFEKFRQLLKNRTAILISHRFSTVENADRIFVLEEGSIIESGSHSELMALDGEYAKLYNLQKIRVL